MTFHEVGESVKYVDDDSDTVSAKDPDQLRYLIEREAGNSAQWLRDSRLCVAGDKSKLLVVGTRQLRASRVTHDMQIVVDNKEILESKSEKLLGILMNNQLTWKNHLHGDDKIEGMVQQLSKRIGVMKKLAKHMDLNNLKFFAS